MTDCMTNPQKFPAVLALAYADKRDRSVNVESEIVASDAEYRIKCAAWFSDMQGWPYGPQELALVQPDRLDEWKRLTGVYLGWIAGWIDLDLGRLADLERAGFIAADRAARHRRLIE